MTKLLSKLTVAFGATLIAFAFGCTKQTSTSAVKSIDEKNFRIVCKSDSIMSGTVIEMNIMNGMSDLYLANYENGEALSYAHFLLFDGAESEYRPNYNGESRSMLSWGGGERGIVTLSGGVGAFDGRLDFNSDVASPNGLQFHAGDSYTLQDCHTLPK